MSGQRGMKQYCSLHPKPKTVSE